MALVVEYHVCAMSLTVGTTAITAGMLVTLNTSAQVVPAPTGTDPDVDAIGIAGDSALAAEGQTTAYSDQVRIGAGATTRYTENRVSDFYDETTASDKITVYNGGGKFWISSDLWDNSGAGCAAGLATGVSGTTAGEWLDATQTDDDICGICLGGVQAYPSGVPGTDTTDGSITLGNYVPVLLRL